MESHARSPAASRLDPVARRYELVAPQDGPLDDLRRHLGLSDASWASVLRHEGVFVDSRRVTSGVVRAGAFVRVYVLRDEPPLPPAEGIPVLWEGGGLVAVDKPAWWSTVPTRASARLCLEAALRERFGLPGLVAAHRLDKQTSGVLVFAADGRRAARMHDLFRARAVDKSYLAVVCPPPRHAVFEVSGSIVRVSQAQYSRYALGEGGRDSHSAFEVLDVRAGRAVVRATPHTGRTHQLRVHLAHAGSPIVGDTVYGPPWRAGAPWSADRTQLHAARMAFLWDGRRVELHAPPPADFEA